MPQAVDPTLTLRSYDVQLYGRTERFYATVRNRLFHGGQISNPALPPMKRALGHIAHLYDWIDSWLDPDLIYPGLAEFTGAHERYPQPNADA